MKKFVYTLAVAALFTGCTKEDANEFDTIGDNQIRFSTGMSVETRAAIEGSSFAGNEEIGIFAVCHTGTSTPAWPSTYHMENVKGEVAADGKVTLPSGASYFWPESDNVDFYAYYPYTSSFTTASGNAPSLDISTPSYTTDYMWADPTINKNKAADGSSAVALTFKHAFSLIKVKVKLSADMPTLPITLTEFSLKTASSTSNQTGTLNIATGLFSSNASASVTYSKNGLSASINNNAFEEVDQIIFAPGTIINEFTAKLNNVVYTKTGLTITAPAATATNILVTISPSGLLFTATVTPWTSGTDQEIIAQ